MVVMGEYDQAKDCYEEALEIRRALFSESDVSVAQVLSNIGERHLLSCLRTLTHFDAL